MLAVVVGAAGLLVALLVVQAAWRRQPVDSFAVWLPSQAAGIVLVLVGTGVRLYRPAHRSGRLLVWAGITWYFGDYRVFDNPVLFGIGFCLAYVSGAVIAHLVLSVPTGRLDSRAERVLVAVAYAACPVVRGAQYLWERRYAMDLQSAGVLPRSGWTVTASALNVVINVAFVAVVAWRWNGARQQPGRSLRPLWLVAIGMAWSSAALSISYLAGADRLSALVLNYSVGLLLVPVLVVSGPLRRRLDRTRVADLVLHLADAPGPEPVRAAVARALDDPSLELYFRLGDCYVDSRGRTVPSLPAGHVVTAVGRDVFLTHRAGLLDQGQLVEAVAAAARLALENAEQRVRHIVAMDDQRRRIQRDLHDGVQHKLLAAAMLVERARLEGTDGAGPAAGSLLARARGQLLESIQELREFAEGVYPPALTEEGLAAALEGIAERAPLPVSLAVPTRRLPERVERTVYFVITEALSNVYKHASAGRAWVRVTIARSTLVVEVADDGAGGADPAAGTGLRGLEDRVAALGGTLRLDSPDGGGTRLVAELPCV